MIDFSLNTGKWFFCVPDVAVYSLEGHFFGDTKGMRKGDTVR